MIDKAERRRRWLAVALGLGFGAISTAVVYADRGELSWYGVVRGMVSGAVFGIVSYFVARSRALWRR